MPCTREFCDLLDMAPYAHLTRWMKRMRELPHWDDVHRVLPKLGPPSYPYPILCPPFALHKRHLPLCTTGTLVKQQKAKL